MTSYLPPPQTGYAAIRCAIEYGTKYLPFVGVRTAEVARNALFGFDLINTAYIGGQVVKNMREKDSYTHRERFYTDIVVKAVGVVALAVLFVIGTNKYLIPQLNLMTLLQKTAIPKTVLDYATDKSFEIVTAAWTKPLLENLTTGLFFIRTILDLYLARSTSNRFALLNASLHAAITFKAAQYRTLEIKNRFTFLLDRTPFFYYPSSIYPTLSEYFKLPIGKVDAIFHLNTDGLSEKALIGKIQSIYDYSVKMFEKSTWNRYWLTPNGVTDYYSLGIEPFDQAVRAMNNSVIRLIYAISLEGGSLPAPVKVYIFHEDKIWQSFKGIDIFKWIPRFCVPGQSVVYSDRIEAILSYPLTRMEQVLTTIQSFLKNCLSQ
jgi:hypothetical protein